MIVKDIAEILQKLALNTNHLFPKDYIDVGFLIKIFKYKCSQGNYMKNQ
jgi:hypothetical protein